MRGTNLRTGILSRFQSARARKHAVACSRKMLLQDLCERIYFDYNNNKRVPHGTFKIIIDEYKDDFPTLNIAMLKVSFGRLKKKKKGCIS